MNAYGHRAMAHWERHAPGRVAVLTDPEEFFTSLGREIEAEITRLASMLAGSDRREETYLEKVARLATARKQAEEVVMAQLVWISDPALPLSQAREEWDQTRPTDENLVVWAERMQDFPDSMPSSEELEEMATTWALSTEFLEGLVATEPPREYLRQHAAELQEAATIRFLRELR